MSLTKATYSMIKGATANVLDFGAVGDGVVDWTSAFQSAIDFCLNNSKTLFIPQGNYLITDPLLINGTRASGSQVTFRMIGEIASDAITQGDGTIESRTNLIFNKTASKLFDIQFNDSYFQNVSFEDFSIRENHFEPLRPHMCTRANSLSKFLSSHPSSDRTYRDRLFGCSKFRSSRPSSYRTH